MKPRERGKNDAREGGVRWASRRARGRTFSDNRNAESGTMVVEHGARARVVLIELGYV